jgi:hypothetical protein
LVDDRGPERERVVQALAPLAGALQADGYALSVEHDAIDRWRVSVNPGPDACAECLVPADIFSAIVGDALSRAGLSGIVDLLTIELPGVEH